MKRYHLNNGQGLAACRPTNLPRPLLLAMNLQKVTCPKCQKIEATEAEKLYRSFEIICDDGPDDPEGIDFLLNEVRKDRAREYLEPAL